MSPVIEAIKQSYKSIWRYRLYLLLIGLILFLPLFIFSHIDFPEQLQSLLGCYVQCPVFSNLSLPQSIFYFKTNDCLLSFSGILFALTYCYYPIVLCFIQDYPHKKISHIKTILSYMIPTQVVFYTLIGMFILDTLQRIYNSYALTLYEHTIPIYGFHLLALIPLFILTLVVKFILFSGTILFLLLIVHCNFYNKFNVEQFFGFLRKHTVSLLGLCFLIVLVNWFITLPFSFVQVIYTFLKLYKTINHHSFFNSDITSSINLIMPVFSQVLSFISLLIERSSLAFSIYFFHNHLITSER